jgi:hypothetical protein
LIKLPEGTASTFIKPENKKMLQTIPHLPCSQKMNALILLQSKKGKKGTNNENS